MAIGYGGPAAETGEVAVVEGGILDCSGLTLSDLRESQQPVLRRVLERLKAREAAAGEVLSSFNNDSDPAPHG